MTDKEVIIDGVDIFKEIDEWADIVSQDWSSDEYSKAEIIKNYILELQAENEELKKEKDLYATWYRAKHDDWADAFLKTIKIKNRYKRALEGIRQVLEYFANSHLGVENLDGTFSLKNEQNAISLNYDPRPAKQGLQIINEVLKDESTQI